MRARDIPGSSEKSSAFDSLVFSGVRWALCLEALVAVVILTSSMSKRVHHVRQADTHLLRGCKLTSFNVADVLESILTITCSSSLATLIL